MFSPSWLCRRRRLANSLREILEIVDVPITCCLEGSSLKKSWEGTMAMAPHLVLSIVRNVGGARMMGESVHSLGESACLLSLAALSPGPVPCPVPFPIHQIRVGFPVMKMSHAPWPKRRKKARGKENPQAFFIVSALGLWTPMNTLLSLGALTATTSHWGVDLEGGRTRGKSGIGLLKRRKRALTRARNSLVSRF
jgi:hypothetical protein